MIATRYWPLLFLLLIPYLWWMPRRGLVGLSRRHRTLSALVRSAIVLLLVAGLMQPVVYRSTTSVSIVYLLDISRSVSPAGIESAIEWIRKTNDTGQPEHARFIPFGENSAVFDDLEQLTNVDVSGEPGRAASIDQSGTAIRDAVERALSAFAPHSLKRLVLITDGNETTGELNEVIGELKKERVPVFTMPEAARAGRDTWIESVTAPQQVNGDELFPVEIQVFSQTDGTAEIEIRNGEKILASRKSEIKRGQNRIAFDVRIAGSSGPVTLEAEVRTTGDSFPENNTFRTAITVEGQPRILYVDGRQESTKYLTQALQLEGFTVDVVPPSRIPTGIDAFDRYDLVLMSDVPRTELNEQQMRSISSYVRDLGGGFVLSGGQNNYGAEGGYFKTTLERILPVSFEAKEKKSVAMIIVLDKSGSMGGLKMELAKEAAKAPVPLLKDTDSFGVVAFDNEFYWPVPLQVVQDREAIIRSISTIAPGGDTNMFPPLNAAYGQLVAANADIKHVILLSDGVSLPGEFQALVRKMAEDKITVSTVSVSMGSDKRLLASIAEWGKGRPYYIEDERKVPQIFTEETELATGKTLKEDPFKPTVKKEVEVFTGVDFKKAPPLLGYVAARPKDTAEILLEHQQEDQHHPILARWQYGLGKTAVFTSDLKDRWAANWINWDGYGKFWSQLIRETMRPHDSEGFDFRVVRDDDKARIAITAVGRDGRFRNKLQPKVRVVAPDQSISTIDVNQVGPGSYESVLPLKQKGAYLFRAFEEENAGPSRLLAYSYPEEYHFYPPNIEALQNISQETGGKFQPTAEEIFNTSTEVTVVPVELWQYFTFLGLLLYMVDVYLRRVRLF
jgi:Ca-activated chloride channel homolog